MRLFAKSTIAVIGTAAVLLASPAAFASGKTVVYNNVPTPLPGNVPSVGFEATSTTEWGGQVSFGGTQRNNPQVSVVMSSWACQSGTWQGDCTTAKNATFQWPITLRVYQVGANNEPGTLIGAVTHTFTMPYRPAANYRKCENGQWYNKSDATCYNGEAFVIKFSMGSLDLPDNAIITVSYNTSDYGYDPAGHGTSCYGQSGGCPYDALNVGTGVSPALVGTQPLPNDTYLDSSWSGAYCDNGAGGTGYLRLDAGCWAGAQPAFKVTAR